MFSIQDQIQVGVYIGESDAEAEFDLRENFVSFQFTSSLSLLAPVARLIVQDTRKVLKDSAALFDGSRIRVRVATGTNFENAQDYPIRIFHVEKPAGGSSAIFLIDGYYDMSTYMSAVTSAPIRGRSVDVMASIASSCGIQNTMLAPATDDVQVWHPNNTRWAKFARDVAQHGYVSDTSCMRLGVDDLGTLRYLDVMDQKPQTGSTGFIFGQDPTKGFRIWESQMIMNSGMNNLDSGYGHIMSQSRVHAADVGISSADIRSNTPLVMNQTLKDQLSQVAKRSFMPIDAGNVNDNFAKARYQNDRIGKTFSAGCLVKTHSRTGYQIMDSAPVEYRDSGIPGETEDNYYTGDHVITDKTIFVRGAAYHEVFRFMRNNINTTPGGAT